MKFIIMLTNHDKTVGDAITIFEKNKDAPTNYWGFKDVGIEKDKIKKLANKMKEKGKTIFFEGIKESEKECIESAKIAIECEFDYFIGPIYSDSLGKILKNSGVKFFPTCGKRKGTPRMLYGTIEETINDAKRIINLGVDGICLSVYRYMDGKPEELAEKFVKSINVPIIMSGTLNNYERLDVIKRMNPWGFTIGTAFFDDSFGGYLSVYEKTKRVIDYLNK